MAAYNFPVGYQPAQMYYPQYQAQPQAQQNQQSNSIIWVSGEVAAKSYIVAPNTTVLLMDSEASKFYLKSSDASGVPLPLRVFEYTEITQKATSKPVEVPVVDYSTFVTKAELDAFRTEIEGVLKNVSRPARRSEKKEVDEDE